MREQLHCKVELAPNLPYANRIVGRFMFERHASAVENMTEDGRWQRTKGGDDLVGWVHFGKG